MTPRQRKLDLLLASVAGTPSVALSAGPRLPQLTSKRLRQVHVLATCDACRGSTPRMWHGQAESGLVLLCEACKSAALDASFGVVDAARLARPTAIESNRRRH